MPDLDSADSVIEAARVPRTKVFFLGCFESRVTVLSQQRRALNLVDAILTRKLVRPRGRVAVVGAGASGLTAAAAFALAAPELEVNLFERTDLLMTFQRESDRDLHPHLYDWPAGGSTQQDAGLPVLNWQAGTAGNVAEQIVEQFKELQQRLPKLRLHRHRLVVGVEARGESHCELEVKEAPLEGGVFDAVILAIGFGYELEVAGENQPYWTRSRLTGPLPPFGPSPLFISGNGDGGLVEFTMAAFNRMPHSDIVRFVVEYPDLDETKQRLLEIERLAWDQKPDEVDIYALYGDMALPSHLILDVGDRLRTDAVTWFHTRQKNLFRRNTAIINRFTMFLAIKADSALRRNRIQLRTAVDFRTLGDQQTIDVGSEHVKPLYRFFRFGPNSADNLKPFEALAKVFEVAHPLQVQLYRPATPELTESAAKRFAAFATSGPPDEVGLPAAAVAPPSIDKASMARQALHERNIERTPASLQLHIESGNADIVALMLAAGMPPDTLLDGKKAPLTVALECIGIDDEWDRVDPVRYAVVKTIIDAGPRGVTQTAHAQLDEPVAPARFLALLRAGVAPEVRNSAGTSLAVRAMRMEDQAGRDSPIAWSRLLVEGGSKPQQPTAQRLLLWAAARGRLEVVRRLLALGVPVDANLQGAMPDSDLDSSERRYWWPGGTALHQVLAAARRAYSGFYDENLIYSEDMLKLLLKEGASPNFADAYGQTPLHIAAEGSLLNAARLMLAHGGDLSLRTSDGRRVVNVAVDARTDTALLMLRHWMPDDGIERAKLLADAVYRRDLVVMEYLLHQGCDPNLGDGHGSGKALIRLADWCDRNNEGHRKLTLPCLKLLLKFGVEPSQRDEHGRTALHLIVYHVEHASAAADMLLSSGADCEARDARGRTPLMNCVDAATAARLISAGASASTTDSDGNDALDLAHMRGAQEATAFLSAGGKTPSASARLVRAVWTQDADELRQALATGASTQTKDQHGSPVLYLSADLQSTDLMSILLDHGADIEARDKHGNTPLRIALSRAGTLDVVEGCIALLLDRHARLDDVNQFHEAAIFFGQQWWWLPEISRRILLPCAQARSKEGNTALMISAERGTPEHVQMLLHLPNPPEISACNSAGLTALHIAANGSAEYGAEQYVEKAELLIKAGAALEAADTNGETPIFKAVASEHRRMVELFIRCGADCRRRNLAGESLATVALRSGSGSLFNWVRSLCG